MKKYMSTGYAWIPDSENTAKTQLHIYTFDNEDEWFEADAGLVDFNAKQEYLSNLGYVSDPIPVISIHLKWFLNQSFIYFKMIGTSYLGYFKF